MDNMIFVDASRARSNFFNILDSVYLKNKSFLIKKAGIPVAEISRPRILLKNKKFFEFAGTWSDIDADEIMNVIYEGRKDRAKLKRNLPKFS
jgi:hypothetical protein